MNDGVQSRSVFDESEDILRFGGFAKIIISTIIERVRNKEMGRYSSFILA